MKLYCNTKYVKLPRFSVGELQISMKLDFSIDSWSAWSSERGGFHSWFENETAEQNKALVSALDVSMIPAMKRRRMSPLSKLAISTALDCTHRSQSLACSKSTSPMLVFASRHGELVRSVKIIESMISQNEISPTDFSLSVHNTALGLYSILTDNMESATSIAAGEDTFGYGLLEACLQLANVPDRQVLYVYFDEPMPPVINRAEIKNAESICIALLLSTSENSKLKFSFSCRSDSGGTSSGESGVDLGQQFLDYCLSNHKKLCIGEGLKRWQWNRQC